LVHGYDKIEQDILWNALEKKLCILEVDIDRLLTELITRQREEQSSASSSQMTSY